MPEFSSEKWKESLGNFWQLLPIDLQQTLDINPEPSSWKNPDQIISSLKLVKLLKQNKFDEVHFESQKVRADVDGFNVGTAFGVIAALAQSKASLAIEKRSQLIASKYNQNLISNIDDQILSLSNSQPEDEPLARDKGSCFVLGNQECSLRFPELKDNLLEGDIEQSESRSLLKKQNGLLSSTKTQVSYPSEANQAASVTLFCAVYHRDENRHALIEEHLENIKSQSLPVEPIYVFEAGDQPSSAAKSYSIVSPSRLSIYQAWYMAMQHSNKKLLINLNLDDRLCPDAVARMSKYFDSDDVMLVGGEWVIANQVARPDQLRNVSIRETYFDPAWPPKKRSFTRSGESLRLGSGTGERGTYGPATMFRRSLLEELQYPLKFGNGDLVESIADSLWWSLIKRKYPSGAIRIPEVVGIYHSDPSSQAEFRATNEWEKLQKSGLLQ
jgi:hypothetical protein